MMNMDVQDWGENLPPLHRHGECSDYEGIPTPSPHRIAVDHVEGVSEHLWSPLQQKFYAPEAAERCGGARQCTA